MCFNFIGFFLLKDKNVENWPKKLKQVLYFFVIFTLLCQLYFYYDHHLLIHWVDRGDFVTFWSFEPKKWCKSGWIETHYHQKELLRKSYSSMVVIGDPMVAGLRCYSKLLI